MTRARSRHSVLPVQAHPHPRGTALAELIAALPLLAVLGAIAVQMVLAAHRHALRVDAMLAATRELRQSANVLAVELRTLRAADLRDVRDTLIEFDATVGVAVVCAVDATRQHLFIAQGAPSDAWSAVWMQAPQAGDDVQLWYSSGPVGLVPMRATLASTRSGAGCDGSPIAAPVGGGSAALELRMPLTAMPSIGAPVRVTRRTRFSLYRATDGDWYLGRRTLGPAGWDVIQPVAGPLQSAARQGLMFAAYSALGTTAVAGDSLAPVARIGVRLRAPRRAGRAIIAGTDSLETQIALRGDHGGSQ